MAERFALKQDFSAVHRIKAEQQLNQRTFAAAAGSHDSDDLAGKHLHGHVDKHLFIRLVGKFHIAKLHRRLRHELAVRRSQTLWFLFLS
ncbi:hypothetical protein D3C81_1931790 [compost metagenome]